MIEFGRLVMMPSTGISGCAYILQSACKNSPCSENCMQTGVLSPRLIATEPTSNSVHVSVSCALLRCCKADGLARLILMLRLKPTLLPLKSPSGCIRGDPRNVYLVALISKTKTKTERSIILGPLATVHPEHKLGSGKKCFPLSVPSITSLFSSISATCCPCAEDIQKSNRESGCKPEKDCSDRVYQCLRPTSQ